MITSGTIFFFVNRKVWQELDNPDKLFGPKVLNALIYLNSDPSSNSGNCKIQNT